jgi:UPF0271 protein
MRLLLNCDLGEGSDVDATYHDEQVMPFIDQVNIACGIHAGNPVIMKKTLISARSNGVTVGAHPSYPDRDGFGRRSMELPVEELIAVVQYQIAALQGMAKNLGVQVRYVKPHGALYNDMMAHPRIRNAVMQAISENCETLEFMLQATPFADEHKKEADLFGLDVIFEAFADRCYDDRGALVARTEHDAVHNREKMLRQVKQLVEHGTVTTRSGKCIELLADSICVHGDNVAAIEAIAEVRTLIT